MLLSSAKIRKNKRTTKAFTTKLPISLLLYELLFKFAHEIRGIFNNKMRTKKINTGTFLIVMLVVFSFASCSSDSDDTVRKPVDEEGFLEDAIYLQVADEEQPAWLQSQIAKSPYLKVFRSGKGDGTFLLQAPLKSNDFSVYDKDGKEMSVSTKDQLQQLVQERRPWTLTHIYSFPIKYGDTEWDLSRYTVAEIKKKLQLPDNLIRNMTTPDLIETCLDYPYSSDFLAFDEIQLGVGCVRQDFNGLDEVLKRKNLAKTMLTKYETKMQTAEVMGTQESLVKGAYSIYFLFFKMLLAQDEVLNQMNRSQLRQLIKLSMKADEMVVRLPDLFGTIHYTPTFFLYSRIIVREGGFNYASDEEKSKLVYFAQTCMTHPSIIAIFTPDMQQRIYRYLLNL